MLFLMESIHGGNMGSDPRNKNVECGKEAWREANRSGESKPYFIDILLQQLCASAADVRRRLGNGQCAMGSGEWWVAVASSFTHYSHYSLLTIFHGLSTTPPPKYHWSSSADIVKIGVIKHHVARIDDLLGFRYADVLLVCFHNIPYLSKLLIVR